jgi:hypothetical protein
MGSRFVLALLALGAFTLSTVYADHERSGNGRNSSHVSPRKAARTHSSWQHSGKKERDSRESGIESKSERRGAKNRDRNRDAAEEQNLIATPAVDLPDREDDQPETDVQSDEESSANLMRAASQPDDSGGDH